MPSLHIDQNAFHDRAIYDTVAETNDNILDDLTSMDTDFLPLMQ